MTGADGVIRRGLFAILILGVAGTLVELLLLKHTDGFWQVAPLALLGAALVILAAHAIGGGAATILALRAVMAVFFLSGAAGVLLHYRGNVEWELERMPSLAGFDLFRHAIMGATPTLAPGTMVQLGLVGLLYTYRHPARRQAQDPTPET